METRLTSVLLSNGDRAVARFRGTGPVSIAVGAPRAHWRRPATVLADSSDDREVTLAPAPI